MRREVGTTRVRKVLNARTWSEVRVGEEMAGGFKSGSNMVSFGLWKGDSGGEDGGLDLEWVDRRQRQWASFETWQLDVCYA